MVRKVNWIENQAMRVGLLPGGGHIGAATLRTGPAAGVNPLWEVPWPSMEPSEFDPARHLADYGGPPEARLLASIMGHNLCLDYFGPPSKEEEAAGLTVHGEAPVAEWEFTASDDSDLAARAELPRSGLTVNRKFTLAPGDPVVRVDTEVESRLDRETEFGWQEHATFGPPFIEKGVTAFDCSAGWCCVDPQEVSPQQRLKPGEKFTWPSAPARNGGRVDLRVFPANDRSEDFTTQSVRDGGEWAWFTAVNPRLNLLAGYIWRAEDFPWLGMWEMNHDREAAPWSCRTLTRGLEFGLSPFAHGREAMRALGSLNGIPVLGRIPPRGRRTAAFHLFLASVPESCTGVGGVEMKTESIAIRVLNPDETVVLKLK